MAETIQESLLQTLLKSRYPLSYYLSRQQEFVNVFSTIQTNTISTPSVSKINIIRKRKPPRSSHSNISDSINHQSVKFNTVQNEINSDQDYNSANDQSSEIDDDASLGIHEKNAVK